MEYLIGSKTTEILKAIITLIALGINFPTLIFAPLFGRLIWVISAIIWADLLPLWIAILKEKNWEFGIWIGLYIAISIATGRFFVPFLFMSCA